MGDSAMRAQILLAVEHIHRCNEVHCDIKPDNVFLTGDEAGNEVRVRRTARQLAVCTLRMVALWLWTRAAGRL